MPLPLMIEPELDERAAAASMSRAQRIYEEGARDISRVMRDQLTDGAQQSGRAIEDMATRARRAYLDIGDAAEKTAQEERRLADARDSGASNVDSIARRVERARLDEERVIRRATDAYGEYERAARSAGEAGERSGSAIVGGLRSATSAAARAGQEAADGFLSGFSGGAALMRLGAAGGPIGIALTGAAALGVAAGRVLVDNIAAGMESMATRDLFQTRLGVDTATMTRYGQVASAAFTDAWGSSVADNLGAIQFAVQGGVIDRGASDAEIQKTIGQMQALAGTMNVDVQEAARATGQLIRGDFANNGTEAADIIVSGFQRGLDISGDWLDTVTEYTTQFRKLGLDGNDALGLIQQGLQGAARDSDVVADSLKEFSIRAVDGSKLTAEGFGALGFNADDMARRFLAGGDSARSAFAATLEAVRSLDDPIQQALTWQALFGTQWEDMGDAINKMDLSTARTEFGSTEGAIDEATNTLSAHVNQWDVLGRSIDQTFSKMQEWLANSAIGEFLGTTLPSGLNGMLFNPPTPGIGSGSYTAPDAVSTPLNPLDVLAGTPPGGGPVASGPGSLLLPSTQGPPPPPGAVVPGQSAPAGAPPVPGARTPILTDMQQEAADAAGGSGKSLPPAPSLPLQYSSTAGLPTQVANAQTRLDESRHEVAEKNARVQQLEQSNVATADDIQKARNDVAKAERDEQQSTQALQDAKVSQFEKMTKESERLAKGLRSSADQLGQIGAQLDDDFGVSKGLAGVAENITKFLANLAFAPVFGALSAQREAAGFGPGEAGGGVVGMLAESGALGDKYRPVPRWARDQKSADATAMGPAGLQVGMGGGYPGDAALLANVQPGKYVSEGGVGDLTKGIGDCTSSIEDLVNFLDGKPTGGRSMSTGNASTWLPENGFLPGKGGPGDFRVGYNGGHMQATLPGGTPWNWGSDTSAARGGIGGTGADDPAFTDHWYRPMGGSPSAGPTYSAPDVYSPANTAPGLNNPAAVTPSYPGVGGVPGEGMPPGPGMPGPLLTGIGGGGAVPGMGMGMPGGFGMGGPTGFGAGPAAASQSVAGGRQFGQGLPASSGISFSGGIIGAAASMAGSAGSFGAGGGAAADLGMQLIGRAIGAGGQYAGNAVGGLMETFMLNDSSLGDPGKSWLGRLAIAGAGMRPALPNSAGALGGEQNAAMAEGGKPQPPGPMTPQQAEAAKAQGGGDQAAAQQGDTYQIEVNNQRATEDGTGRDIQAGLSATQASKQPR